MNARTPPAKRTNLKDVRPPTGGTRRSQTHDFPIREQHRRAGSKVFPFTDETPSQTQRPSIRGRPTSRSRTSQIQKWFSSRTDGPLHSRPQKGKSCILLVLVPPVLGSGDHGILGLVKRRDGRRRREIHASVIQVIRNPSAESIHRHPSTPNLEWSWCSQTRHWGGRRS